ncbi:MAG: alpha-glucan family phosphorylase, partial [Planctomycetota bacterium]
MPKARRRKRVEVKRSTRTGVFPTRSTSGLDFPEHELVMLAHDLLWTWKPAIRRVFEALDPPIWRAMNQNPLKTIAALSPERRATLAADPNFQAALAAALAEQRDYHSAKGWHDRKANGSAQRMRVAYFCMEYGLHESLPLYSGGLGILAADHVKSASDLNIPLTAIGILWREGYYRQELETDGSTRVVFETYDFDHLPVTDTKKSVTVRIGSRDVVAKIWLLRVGRVEMYLLDTDHEANSKADRALTHRLYSGDTEHRIRQEVLLGVG